MIAAHSNLKLVCARRGLALEITLLIITLLGGAGNALAASAPHITSPTTDSGITGVPYSYQITVRAQDYPITLWGATPMPPGLSFNTTTGLISGTPTTVGIYSITLSATNGNGTGTQPLTLTISNPPNGLFVGFRLPDFLTPSGVGYTPRLMLQMGATDPIGAHPFNVTLEVDASDAHDWSKPVPYNRFEGIDDSASWITNAPLPVRDSAGPTGAPQAFNNGQLTQPQLPAVYMKGDPRATRFGIFQMDTNSTGNSRIIDSIWPRASATLPNGYGGAVSTSFPGPVEHAPNRFSAAAYYPATFAINGSADARDTATTIYADNDNVTRPADAIYRDPANNETGSSTPYYVKSTDPNAPWYHPIILNRPFRNVAELGYAFRDLPWKTLDFFTDNSADAGLLDIFMINDGPVVLDTSGIFPPRISSVPTMVAGSVNLNTTQAADTQSVLAGAIWDEISSSTVATTGSGAQTAATMASNITSAALATPLQNKAEIVTRRLPDGSGLPLALLPLPTTSQPNQTVKARREAVPRAISSISQTRVWNVVIDVVAQSGRYAPGETDLKKFVVQGEQHYLVHVAIDRFTGQVIDKQIEVINE
jgi:hypothetical protein